MADMRADDNVIAVATIGGTGTTRVKYDGEGLRVHIYRRFAGLPWTKLNLIMETGATTAEQAARAEITGRFTTPAVGAGQEVARGAVLGTLSGGHAGCPVAACLHWGLRRGEVYLDPLSLLAPPEVRLLPMG